MSYLCPVSKLGQCFEVVKWELKWSTMGLKDAVSVDFSGFNAFAAPFHFRSASIGD
jgi:hypothetical protein